MLKNLENIFIWIMGGVFALAAAFTVGAYVVGLLICIKRYVYG